MIVGDEEQFNYPAAGMKKFQDGLKASVQAHGGWHSDQGKTAPPIHIHLIRVGGHPNLRALLVHPRRCVLKK